jgi:hypothetical protein
VAGKSALLSGVLSFTKPRDLSVALFWSPTSRAAAHGQDARATNFTYGIVNVVNITKSGHGQDARATNFT